MTFNVPLLCPILATCSAHLITRDLITQHNVSLGEQIIKLLVMQSYQLPCYLVPLRPKCLPQHPIL